MTTPDALDLPLTPPPGGKVLHESSRCTIVWGDCADLVGSLPTVDLLATDPPYGVKWNSGRNSGRFGPLLGDDGTLDVPGLLGAITRAHVRRKRHVYVFGYRPGQLSEPMQLGGMAELVWDKGVIGPGSLDCPWGPQHEIVAFGVHNQSAANRARGDGNLAARLRSGSVLRYQRPNAARVTRHPTEKPVPLMRELIESSSRQGDMVLDPFAGSGSTLVAAILAGRRAYGIELDHRYAELAVERVRAAERIADQIAAA
ncbi:MULTISPECIES: DNA-methyltransferase [Streptomyces]|uniref:DNA-methyltransferase n=1 Tax=Streptomyces TaxID=1883 RepID=UPI0027E49F42|nr:MULTISPECIES: DNA methyltransferase [Streptomyces]